MSTAMLENARRNLAQIESLAAIQPNNPNITGMLAQAKTTLSTIEANMGLTRESLGVYPGHPNHQQPQIAPQQGSLEQRVAALEQGMSGMIQAATPAISQAAQAGATLFAAFGAVMTPEQAQFVQERANTSPAFLQTDAARACASMLIEEWVNYEKAATP